MNDMNEDRKDLRKEVSQFLFEYDFSESSYHQRALAYIKNVLGLLDTQTALFTDKKVLTTINGNKVLVYGIFIVNNGIILVNGKIKLNHGEEHVLISTDNFDCNSVIKILRYVSRTLKNPTTASDYGDKELLEDVEEME